MVGRAAKARERGAATAELERSVAKTTDAEVAGAEAAGAKASSATRAPATGVRGAEAQRIRTRETAAMAKPIRKTTLGRPKWPAEA